MKIAVLLTCHNRKAMTLNCLSVLQRIAPQVDVYLVDDGSTDGTGKAVYTRFPGVHLLHGDGSLFWNRGMVRAWKEALKRNYEAYVWLNDDVTLYDNAFDELESCSKMLDGKAIVSGIIENPSRDAIIYGGADRRKHLIQPNGKPQPVTFMNGNVVWVPGSAVELIGILDPYFHHDLGDVDYGLRAQERGIQVVTTRTAVGKGLANNYCRVRAMGMSMCERFKRLYSPLGSNPRLNFYFRRRHFGLMNASMYWVYLHVLNFLPDSLVIQWFGNRYV